MKARAPVHDVPFGIRSQSKPIPGFFLLIHVQAHELCTDSIPFAGLKTWSCDDSMERG